MTIFNSNKADSILQQVETKNTRKVIDVIENWEKFAKENKDEKLKEILNKFKETCSLKKLSINTVNSPHEPETLNMDTKFLLFVDDILKNVNAETAAAFFVSLNPEYGYLFCKQLEELNNPL